jgi:hypothetical protein
VKKFIISLLTVALVCSLSISLVGCGGNKTSSGKTTSSGSASESSPKKGGG